MTVGSGLVALVLFAILPGTVALILTLTHRWPRKGE